MTKPKVVLPEFSNEQINAAVEAFHKAGWGHNEVMWKCWLEGMRFAAAVLAEALPVAWIVEVAQYGDHRACKFPVLNLSEISDSIPKDKIKVMPLVPKVPK